MDYSLFNSVRSAINKIHQYDESTALRGEVLDGELREVNESCGHLREKLVELRKQRSQNEAALEDATVKKQMAKRSCEQKYAMILCLEAEGERLESMLSKQETVAKQYYDDTQEDQLSKIIKSIKGMHLEKKSALDELRAACMEKRKHVEQMKADIAEVAKKEPVLDELKLSLANKEANLAMSVKVNEENQCKMKDLTSSKARISGELQFVLEKFEGMKERLLQLKSRTNAEKEKEISVLQQKKEWEDRHAIIHEQYSEMESAYQDKMVDIKKMVGEIQSLEDTLDGINQAKAEYGVKEKEFSELSAKVEQLQISIHAGNIVENDMTRVSDEVETLKNEQAEKQMLLGPALEKLVYLRKINEVATKDEEQLNAINVCWEDLVNINHQLSSQIHTLNENIKELRVTLENVRNEMYEVTDKIAKKESEISDMQITLEEMPESNEIIEHQRKKLEELDNEIIRLEEHENNVKTEIQEQGKFESDRMQKEIADIQRNIRDLRIQHEDLSIKRIQGEESFAQKIADVRNQRNEYISQAVEKGIQEIDIKLKNMKESVRKSHRDVLMTQTPKKSILKSIENTKSNANAAKDNKNMLGTDKFRSEIDKQPMLKKAENTKPREYDVKGNDYISETDGSDSDDPFGTRDSSDTDDAIPSTSRTPVKHSCVAGQSNISDDNVINTPNSSGRKKRQLQVSKKIGSNATSYNSSSKEMPSHVSKDESRANSGMVSSMSNVKSTITPMTPGRSKKILIQPSKDKHSGASSIQRASLGNTAPASNSMTPARAKKILIPTKTGYQSGVSLADEDVSRSISNTPGSSSIQRASSSNTPPASNSMTPARAKKILIPTKRGYQSGVSSADEDVRRSISNTPGSRREHKRFLITKKSN